MSRLIIIYGIIRATFLRVALLSFHHLTQPTHAAEWWLQGQADTLGRGTTLQWDLSNLCSTHCSDESSGTYKLCPGSVRQEVFVDAAFHTVSTHRCNTGAFRFLFSTAHSGERSLSPSARTFACTKLLDGKVFLLNCFQTQNVDCEHGSAPGGLSLSSTSGQSYLNRQDLATKLATLFWRKQIGLRLGSWQQQGHLLVPTGRLRKLLMPKRHIGIRRTGNSPIHHVLSTTWGWPRGTEHPEPVSQTQRCFLPACEPSAGSSVWVLNIGKCSHLKLRNMLHTRPLVQSTLGDVQQTSCLQALALELRFNGAQDFLPGESYFPHWCGVYKNT